MIQPGRAGNARRAGGDHAGPLNADTGGQPGKQPATDEQAARRGSVSAGDRVPARHRRRRQHVLQPTEHLDQLPRRRHCHARRRAGSHGRLATPATHRRTPDPRRDPHPAHPGPRRHHRRAHPHLVNPPPPSSPPLLLFTAVTLTATLEHATNLLTSIAAIGGGVAGIGAGIAVLRDNNTHAQRAGRAAARTHTGQHPRRPGRRPRPRPRRRPQAQAQPGAGRPGAAAVRRGEKTVQQIADLFGVPRSTVYGYLNCPAGDAAPATPR